MEKSKGYRKECIRVSGIETKKNENCPGINDTCIESLNRRQEARNRWLSDPHNTKKERSYK